MIRQLIVKYWRWVSYKYTNHQHNKIHPLQLVVDIHLVGCPEMYYLKNEPYSITIPIQIRTKVKSPIKTRRNGLYNIYWGRNGTLSLSIYSYSSYDIQLSVIHLITNPYQVKFFNITFPILKMNISKKFFYFSAPKDSLLNYNRIRFVIRCNFIY